MTRAVLTLVTYPRVHAIAALHSMPFFRFPLSRNKKLSFFKLLGTGRSGTFDIYPNWTRYGIFTVSAEDMLGNIDAARYEDWKKEYYGGFISGWWKFFHCKTVTLVLEPIFSHGSWDGKELFAGARGEAGEGPMAVLTRATIRPGKAADFWRNVPAVQASMKDAAGLQFSVGIGEMPLLRQATLSVWENEASMKAFAYSKPEHREVIRRTRERNWYSEEMFTRFRVVDWLIS